MTLKSWATPLAIGAFIISGVTGLLLFFDIEIGLVEPVHKWLSWLFLGGILLHTASNWKVFTGYFSKKAGLGIIGTAALVTMLSLLPMFGEDEEEHGKESTGKAAVQALESSSLETVALVLKATPEELAARLEKEGIDAANASMTIAEIAQKSGKDERMVLGALFGKPGKGGEERMEGDDDDH
ncbi:MAG: DUF4405 domain-containing protein [Chlorobium sp.]|uniref:DUF4405 domain-containing protein n=1 Tax=Chlorobium sp. TaxID=1095 RepID=UPI0025C510AD|nr:DUF4405 domain-containing protein [Chlorobium sp.]MCF8383819.1 DUF4405 domain-containing protein [Chlorobium sp.]